MPTILFFFCGHGCILSVAHISSGQTSCDVSWQTREELVRQSTLSPMPGNCSQVGNVTSLSGPSRTGFIYFTWLRFWSIMHNTIVMIMLFMSTLYTDIKIMCLRSNLTACRYFTDVRQFVLPWLWWCYDGYCTITYYACLSQEWKGCRKFRFGTQFPVTNHVVLTLKIIRRHRPKAQNAP